MSWNTRNKKETIKMSTNRHDYKCALAWAWLKKYDAGIAKAIAKKAARRYPHAKMGRPIR